MITRFADFRAKAIEIKPIEGDNPFHLICMGLQATSYKLLETVNRYTRISPGIILMSPEKVSELRDRIGDVSYFLAGLAEEMKYTVSEDIEHPVFFTVSSMERSAQITLSLSGKVSNVLFETTQEGREMNKEEEVEITDVAKQIVRVLKVLSSQIGCHYNEILVDQLQRFALEVAD